MSMFAPPVHYVIYFLKECLVDIGLALSLSFPATSVHKLYRRQAYCFAQQGNRAGAVSGRLVNNLRLLLNRFVFVKALETAERKLTSCASLSQSKKGKCTLAFTYVQQ